MLRFSRLPRLVTGTIGIFFALALIAPLPFAIVLPGEAQNIFKGVITFKGLNNYPAHGRIDLMSIKVTNFMLLVVRMLRQLPRSPSSTASRLWVM